MRLPPLPSAVAVLDSMSGLQKADVTASEQRPI